MLPNIWLFRNCRMFEIAIMWSTVRKLLRSKDCLAVDDSYQPTHWGNCLFTHSQDFACSFGDLDHLKPVHNLKANYPIS